MVDVVLGTDGVIGAGLMGAGGGGYVLILARRGALDAVRAALTREYYAPLGKEPDVEAWHPTAAACRLA
jgi:galactokinase